ncbi:hypothetical protein GCM10023116_37010 [Kistimonas scapharcae]|uniref:Uncharacterized protein n=1 Tax=Kistimonas scapharcae TaxID=1036133 RepID=A0ABP8V6A8_9GAMM
MMKVSRSDTNVACLGDQNLISDAVTIYKSWPILKKEEVCRKINSSECRRVIKNAYKEQWLGRRKIGCPVDVCRRPIYKDDTFRIYTYPPVLVDVRSNEILVDFRAFGLELIKGVRRSKDGNILRIRSHERCHFFISDESKWKRYIGMDTCPDELFSSLFYCNQNKKISLLQSASNEIRKVMNKWNKDREAFEAQRFSLKVYQDKKLVVNTESQEVMLNINRYPIGCITGYVFSHDGSSLLIQADGKLSLFVKWPYENGCECGISDEERGECWKPYLKGINYLGCDRDTHSQESGYVHYDGVINLDTINSGITRFFAENLLHKSLAFCEPHTPTTTTSDQWFNLIKLLLENGSNPNQECQYIGPDDPEEVFCVGMLPNLMTPLGTALIYAANKPTSGTKSALHLLKLLYKYGARLPIGCQSAQPAYKDT